MCSLKSELLFAWRRCPSHHIFSRREKNENFVLETLFNLNHLHFVEPNTYAFVIRLTKLFVAIE